MYDLNPHQPSTRTTPKHEGTAGKTEPAQPAHRLDTRPYTGVGSNQDDMLNIVVRSERHIAMKARSKRKPEQPGTLNLITLYGDQSRNADMPCHKSLGILGALTTAFLLANLGVARAQYSYRLNSTDNDTITITSYKGSGGALTIPKQIDGKTVTGIGNSAFDKEQKTLICCPLNRNGGVTIPDGVTIVANSAFAECMSLTNVTIPASLAKIGGFAFMYCTSLKTVCFKGDAPIVEEFAFCCNGGEQSTIYYLAGTKGWGATFGDRPTKVWKP